MSKFLWFIVYSLVSTINLAYATELTKEATIQKENGVWNGDGFQKVSATDKTVTFFDPVYKEWQKKFNDEGIGGGMGARFEGLDMLRDAGIDYTFDVNDNGLTMSFSKDKKPISPSDVPDGIDAKVVLFANFSDGKTVVAQNTPEQAANISAPAPTIKANGGCTSNGSSVLLFAIVAALMMEGKHGTKTREQSN